MMHSSFAAPRDGRILKRIGLALLLLGLSAFLLYTAMKAIGAAFDNDDFPESLAVKVELLPVIFPVHMVAGGLALLLIPAAWLLRRHPRWHRPVGWAAAADVLLAGVTAYPVALVVPVTSASAVGFSVQASVWLVLLAMALHAILHRRVERHRACMLLMAAATSGAIFFRIFLALWAIFGTHRYFETFYACDAWAAWMMPVAAMALFLWRRPVMNLPERSGSPRRTG